MFFSKKIIWILIQIPILSKSWVYFKGFYLNVTAYFKIGCNRFIIFHVLKFSFYIFVS